MLRCFRMICVCAPLATVLIGCGSGKEIGPTATTPQINEAEVKQQMDKSKEMSIEMMKKRGKTIPPGAGTGGKAGAGAGEKSSTP